MRERGYAVKASSNLLEAELAATLVREEVTGGPAAVLGRIDWVFPRAPLSAEIAAVLAAGCARGADVWHLACAPWVRRQLGSIEMLTLDDRQRELALALGLS